MLPAESLGWTGFQALKVRLEGRLARLRRSRAGVTRPTEFQNNADFLDCDLHDIFQTPSLGFNLSEKDYGTLNRGAEDFVALISDMVNENTIHSAKASESPAYEEPKHADYKTSDDIKKYDIGRIRNAYPKLSSLVLFLDMSDCEQFDLVADPNSSLFILPRKSEDRAACIRRVGAWKEILQRLTATADSSRSWHGISLPQTCLDAPLPTEHRSDMLQNRVGFVIDAILKEFQQIDCGMTHEIKLRVSEDTHKRADQTKLEMFMSCCLSGGDWHEAVCGFFGAPRDLRKKGSICTSIQKTRERRTKLRLHVDQRGLFNVTDEGQAIPTSLHDYKEESLSYLLQNQSFREISITASEKDLALKRFTYQEKITLALALARCFMDVFDKSFDHAFCNWNSENVFLRRSTHSRRENKLWYVMVGSRPSSLDFSEIHDKIIPGNPVVLLFAKLLLEILYGERSSWEISLDDPQKNRVTWCNMCVYISEVQSYKASFYLEAVEECLNLHKGLSRLDDEEDNISPGAALREAIYKRIIKKLEQELKPESGKRKRRESFSETSSPSAKKAFNTEPWRKEQGYRQSEYTTQYGINDTAATPSRPRNTSSPQMTQDYDQCSTTRNEEGYHRTSIHYYYGPINAHNFVGGQGATKGTVNNTFQS